jgi:hypothetical protein
LRILLQFQGGQTASQLQRNDSFIRAAVLHTEPQIYFPPFRNAASVRHCWSAWEILAVHHIFARGLQGLPIKPYAEVEIKIVIFTCSGLRECASAMHVLSFPTYRVVDITPAVPVVVVLVVVVMVVVVLVVAVAVAVAAAAAAAAAASTSTSTSSSNICSSSNGGGGGLVALPFFFAVLKNPPWTGPHLVPSRAA